MLRERDEMNTERFEELKEEFEKTGAAPQELDQYRVDNAVILAAGVTGGSIYAPPKGLFRIDDEPIIERQIRQILDVGISKIYIVVGYKKEMYFYLEKKYPEVTLIGNPRIDKNNIYSLYLARHVLRNSYVCACDYYYRSNPFSAYEFRAYHTTAYLPDAHAKLVVKTNHKGRITEILAGADEGECIHGIAYLDRDFSEALVQFMEQEINNYRVSSLFWQEFCSRHFDDLELYTKRLEPEEAMEFDDMRALRSMSLLFVDSVSKQIVKNICEQLGCVKDEITYVDVLDAGHSNITFKVVAQGRDYVYRYPGVSGKNIVSRERETYFNRLGNRLGIDNTLLFIDPSGHKLSTYVPNAHPLDPHNPAEVGALAKLVRKLHQYEASEEEINRFAFDPIREADRLLGLACANKDDLFELFRDTREAVQQIDAALKRDRFPKAVCHCNLNSNNCLITDHSFDLIDWEFSSYCDIAYDFPFLGDYDFREKDLFTYLTAYYDREPTEAEYRHWLCYRAVHYWYYTCWAIYKESLSEDCGNLLLVFYEDCVKCVELAKRYIDFDN